MHYINLAKENYYKYIDKPEQVSLKKYVYILRGLGCMEFIAKTNKIPPLNWKESYIYLPHEIKKVFEKIVELKKKTEASRGKRYGEVDRWVEEEFMKKIEQDKESFNFEEINDIAVKNINNFDKT
jgi:predicted nucleotidyltransferase